jgi:predicted O-linked N-acetylglucosamine transferase (SPINDLY family)
MSSAEYQQKLQTAFSLHQAGRLAQAADLYRDIIKTDPANFFALHYLGAIEAGFGKLEQAKSHMARSLSIQPPNIQFIENYATLLDQMGECQAALQICEQGLQLNHTNAALLYVSAVSLFKLAQFEAALAHFDKLLLVQPNYIVAINERGSVLAVMQRYDEALASFEKALALQPQYAEAHLNKGNLNRLLKRYDSALSDYGKALSLKPGLAFAWLGRGHVLRNLRRYEEALIAYDKGLAISPGLAEMWLGRGNAFTELKHHDEAFAAYDKALALKPNLASAWLGRGIVFYDLKRFEEAFAAYDKALALEPDFAEAWLGRGNVFVDLKRYDEAFSAFDKALALKPDLASAWLGRGIVFYELKRFEEAFAAYDKALALKTDLAEAWVGRGNILDKLKRHEEAAAAFAEALKIDPQHPFTKGSILHQKMLACDWTGVDEAIAEIDNDIAMGRLAAEPFGWQGVAQSQRSQQLCAELYNRNKFPANISTSRRQPSAGQKKIRIGYSSGELREHATSHLIVGLLEQHDKSRFEIYGVDSGWDDKSEMRKRIDASVRGMIDISRLSHSSAAAAIRENQIDILVNLNGYFGEQRTQVFAQRPAPIQVNYLGFPGTLGASYIDYIVADRQVIPPSHMEFYTEKVVYLPNSYQANDRKKEIGARLFNREECGLPQQGFVFCCFNNNYKITPAMFGCWMRILKRVEGSVLWLIEDTAGAAANLKKEAAARGVAPERLVFAKRMPQPDHLARHRMADLFLDTLPCNAHTTASDALWTGLPVLTQAGETFSGKVAASVLTAIGLPELITSTPQDYENLALELATNPEKLAAIKAKLAQNRLSKPLFDTQLFTRHIESAYEAMYERLQKGLPPDHIYVSQ